MPEFAVQKGSVVQFGSVHSPNCLVELGLWPSLGSELLGSSVRGRGLFQELGEAAAPGLGLSHSLGSELDWAACWRRNEKRAAALEPKQDN